MFNHEKLKNVLTRYKQDFDRIWWSQEDYKWEAVKSFQDNWKKDWPDFSEKLKYSLAKADNLLGSSFHYPRKLIVDFAKAAPKEVQEMFRALFDDSQNVFTRMKAFKLQSSNLLKKYGNGGANHFQDENAISIYLWLHDPDKYYIYKFGVVDDAAKALGASYSFKKGAYENNIRNYLKFYDEIREDLRKDKELLELVRTHLTPDCYPDPEFRTLTSDIAFYISMCIAEEDSAIKDSTADPVNSVPPTSAVPAHWWLTANPRIWSFSNIQVGQSHSYNLYNENGNKRRIFQNFLDAKIGDLVVCYESAPVMQIVGLGRICAEQDGEKLSFEKTEVLSSPLDYEALKKYPELEQMDFFQNTQGSLLKLTEAEYDFILDLIRDENPAPSTAAAEAYTKRDFLDEVYMTEARYDKLTAVLRRKKNIILQGAPGVGKTFAARRLAWSMMGEKDDSRIEFVQLHQNYSYEDFVMGYKPVEDGFELKYGIFYRFCQKAANQPDKDFFFLIDEINRGNLSKIFGELLVLIEKDYRGTQAELAYNGLPFSVPQNLYLIGMMNTADRSLAMIDYALRRRFSFFEMEPGFDSEGFLQYQNSLNSEALNQLIDKVKELNREISRDKSLGKGFCIGHSYFCGEETCTGEWLRAIVEFDILPMLSEYWFDDTDKLQKWENILQGALR